MTLTREEILNQKPGRKLDRWIQEHILKWIPWAEQRRDHISVTYQKPGEREPYRGSQNWKSQMDRYSIIPFYEIDPMKHIVYGDKDWSTDISAAWEVIEKLDYEMTVKKYEGMAGYLYWCRVNGADVNRFDEKIVTCKKAPEAICKAALLAVLNL